MWLCTTRAAKGCTRSPRALLRRLSQSLGQDFAAHPPVQALAVILHISWRAGLLEYGSLVTKCLERAQNCAGQLKIA